MRDPYPENINGEKTVSHTVNHHIRWDYLALGVAAFYVVWKVSESLSATSSEEEGVGVDIPVEEIGGNNQVQGLGTEV